MDKPKISILWLRRDLRLYDNKALFHALNITKNVQPLFIFDTDITQQLPKDDIRLQFVYNILVELHKELRKYDASMLIKIGKPRDVFKQLSIEFDIEYIFYNEDYEPYGRKRDEQIIDWAQKEGIIVNSYCDHLIFHPQDIVKNDKTPYTVFTPYSRKWKDKLVGTPTVSFDCKNLMGNLLKDIIFDLPSFSLLGFKPVFFNFPDKEIPIGIIEHYDKFRDFPAKNATTKLGIHIRFGTLSIRELLLIAQKYNEIWLNELIWREFFIMLLYHFPYVQNNAFKKKYEHINWINDECAFEKWHLGQTGYPIVDAGMRELNATGFMHNRVRMIVAGFLTKHLLIDWRWGEAYFAEKLLDYELASNNGNWQWAASTGADAVPYFRIFNPLLQTQKFDKDMEYIIKWVPEYLSKDYPDPIVKHDFARKRALFAYKL